MALGPIFGVLFDGFAYGMLLFLLSVGLSVTLGMMNFVNLAHCAFAMLGGYVTVTLINRYGWPFLATLPLAFLLGGGGERRLRAHSVSAALPRRRTRSGALDHRARLHVGGGCGVSFRHGAAADRDAGLSCAARLSVLGVSFGSYRLFLVAMGLAVTAPAGADAGVHALRRPGARGSRQPAHGARARASMSTRRSRSPLRLAAGLPDLAARSPSKSSGSITPLRLPIWSMS